MKKIVILGPESTGKSTLTKELAEHYQTVYCPEYARDYLTHLGRPYRYDDLLDIAKGQLALEDKMAKDANGKHYFIDTDMQVMKVWCEVAFEKCHPLILKEVAQREYDLFLLCNTDLPWVMDNLREYPDQAVRDKLYLMYKDLVVQGNTPWVEITGIENDRLKTAIDAVDRLSS